MLQILKQLDLDSSDLDDMVFMLAIGKMAMNGYHENFMEPPQWLKDKVEQLGDVVSTKRRDNLKRALREARARQSALQTMDEKRQSVKDEIARLERALG